MNDANERVLKFFREWEGYPPIAAAMTNNPETKCYVAGGVVRDAHLGRSIPSKDIDIFLEGAGCKHVIDSFAKQGTMEIGTFGAYEWTPNAAPEIDCDIILVDKFFNGLWRCTDMLDALNQFDCTVNALAIDLRTGYLLDPQNGRQDIRTKTMRAVRFDFPNEPIAQNATLTRNAVLWWRLLHYASSLGLEIEPVTSAWLAENRKFEAYREDFERTFYKINEKALLPLAT